MLSAGVAQGLNTCFKVPASASSIGTIGKHAAHHSIAMVSKMGAEAAINRRTDGKGAALTAVASILGAKLANEIGDLNACGKIDFMTHKVLHALKGAAGGLIVGGKDGMKAGALGAFVAEFVAEAITPTNGIDHKHDTYSKKRVHITKEVSKVVAGLVAVAAGMDAADVSIAILEATTSVDNNFEHSLKKRAGGLETIQEEEDEDGYNSDGSVDTEDEAKKSTAGQLREGYIEPLAKAAKAVGLDKVAQAEADVNNEFGGTVTEFVEAQLALREQRTGEPLTNAERAKLSGQYEQMYDAYATGNGFKEIAEIIASVPSKCVEWGLRYSGATSKGTARAVGNMTNDVRAALGGAAAVKGILKSGIKAAKNVASKSIPIKKAIHIGKGSGLKPKIPVNSNNPLPANLNRMSVPHSLAGVSEVNGIQQLAQQIGGKPGAGLKTTLTPTMTSNVTKPVIPATNTGTINGQNQTRKLVEATIGVNAKPVGGAIPNKPVMLLETAEKASVAAKKVRDAQAAAKQSADAINKAPYNPRAFEQHLNNIHGTDNVASNTLPKQSMPNVKLAGKELELLLPNGRTVNIPFDQRGFPIFDHYSVYETKLSSDVWAVRDRSKHFKSATLDLKKSIENGSMPSTNFSETQLRAIMKGEQKIPDFTWHHDQNKIQLIPEFIHNHPSMRHVGGYGMRGNSK